MPKSKRVLLLMDLDRGSTRDTLRGVSKFCNLHNPWAVYRLSQFYWKPGHKRNRKEIEQLKQWEPDGIITREMEHVEELFQLNVPIIGFDRARDEKTQGVQAFISSDFANTGNMAAEYFLEKGFKNFAFCGYSEVNWSTKRLEGFQQTLSSKGFEVQVYMKPMANLRQLWGDEINRISTWLKTLPKSTGIMTCSDDRSLHLLEACKASSILVPEVISILGVDNDDILCDMANPPLSSIAFNNEEVGYEAARVLGEMMNGRKFVKNLRIVAQPTSVITRRSSDIFSIEDPQVISALAYIHENRFKLLGVSDVVSVTNVSRRNLELRFKKCLNRSILDEIKRVHVDMMAELLIGTNYSISKIALILGHRNTENICRYFKSQKKMSPIRFREMYEKPVISHD